MMGKQSGQILMVILNIDSMLPEDPLVRRIKNRVNFDFIYEKAAPIIPLLAENRLPHCSDKKAADWLSLWDQIRAGT